MFGIRDVHYAFYRVVLVGEITIRFLSNLAQKSTISYPEFTEHSARAWNVLGHSSHSLSPPTTDPSHLQTPSYTPHPISVCSGLLKFPPCYSLDGIGFQMTWNIVPDDMEQESR